MNHRSILMCILLLQVLCITLPCVPFADQQNPNLIVLDPGHGGNDLGARGKRGTVEKKVVLALAEMIRSHKSRQYEVVLTRTDDYQMMLPERTAVANSRKADLFISLHAGGSFNHKAHGITVYYFQSKEFGKPSPINPSTPLYMEANPSSHWNRQQLPHIQKSRHLAEVLQKQLTAETVFTQVSVKSAPIVLLEGLAMPAVLIETGYLSNPDEEKLLMDETTRNTLASAIHNGINRFLEPRE